jgi:hypothetical protein
MEISQRPDEQSRFQRTVQYLQNASPQLRGEFATVALESLADAYMEEARFASGEARLPRAPANLRGWSVAVNRFARQIPLLLDDIEFGLPVRLFIGGDKSLAVVVADRTVMLSHPRLNQQNMFEQAILTKFCDTHSCELFTPGEGAPEPIAASSGYVRPDWIFTTQGAVCSYRGITVRFKSQHNLAQSRLICEQFLQEVMFLTNAISWQQGLAVPIEWSEIEIQPAPRRPEHIVRLNKLGDTVLASIPVIYGSPLLLEHVIPWVRQWLANRQAAEIELDAETYGWEQN